jgi:spore germination protein GerM
VAARVTRRITRRRFRIGCIAVACGFGALVSACGTGAQSEPVKLSKRQVPFELLAAPTTTTPTTAAPTRKYPFVVYFETNDGIVFAVRTSGTAPKPQTVAAALLEGPTGEETQVGMRTAIPPRAVARVSNAVRGMVTVDLNPAFAQVVLAEQKIALTQLVYTMTSLHGVNQVQFLLDGQRISVPRGNGTLTDKPVKRADYAAHGTS